MKAPANGAARKPRRKAGGRPRIDQKTVALVVARLGQDFTERAAALEAGISTGSANRIHQDNRDAIEEAKRLAQSIALANVLEDAGAATRARLADARAKPNESRTAPQSYRVAHEAAGIIGPASVHVGDVVNVDARSVTILPGREVALSEEDRERYRKLRGEIG